MLEQESLVQLPGFAQKLVELLVSEPRAVATGGKLKFEIRSNINGTDYASLSLWPVATARGSDAE